MISIFHQDENARWSEKYENFKKKVIEKLAPLALSYIKGEKPFNNQELENNNQSGDIAQQLDRIKEHIMVLQNESSASCFPAYRKLIKIKGLQSLIRQVEKDGSTLAQALDTLKKDENYKIIIAGQFSTRTADLLNDLEKNSNTDSSNMTSEASSSTLSPK